MASGALPPRNHPMSRSLLQWTEFTVEARVGSGSGSAPGGLAGHGLPRVALRGAGGRSHPPGHPGKQPQRSARPGSRRPATRRAADAPAIARSQHRQPALPRPAAQRANRAILSRLAPQRPKPSSRGRLPALADRRRTHRPWRRPATEGAHRAAEGPHNPLNAKRAAPQDRPLFCGPPVRARGCSPSGSGTTCRCRFAATGSPEACRRRPR